MHQASGFPPAPIRTSGLLGCSIHDPLHPRNRKNFESIPEQEDQQSLLQDRTLFQPSISTALSVDPPFANAPDHKPPVSAEDDATTNQEGKDWEAYYHTMYKECEELKIEARRELETASQSNETVQSELDIARKQIAELIQDNERYENSLKDLTVELGRVQSALGEAQEQIKDLNTGLHTRDDLGQQLRDQRAATVARESEFRDYFRELRDKNTRLRNERNSARAQAQALKGVSVKELQDECDAAMFKIQELQEECNRLNREDYRKSRELHDTIRDLKSAVEELKTATAGMTEMARTELDPGRSNAQKLEERLQKQEKADQETHSKPPKAQTELEKHKANIKETIQQEMRRLHDIASAKEAKPSYPGQPLTTVSPSEPYGTKCREADGKEKVIDAISNEAAEAKKEEAQEIAQFTGTNDMNGDPDDGNKIKD